MNALTSRFFAQADGRDVAVLFGGTTGERAVSLDTGHAFATALERNGARVTRVDLDGDDPSAPRWRVPALGWSGSGPEALVGPLRDVELCFVGLHGGFGEGGPLQGFLQSAGMPYTGSGPAASSLCLDKWTSLLVAEQLGLATAPRLLQAQDEPLATFGQRVCAFAERHEGIVLKPRRGGSSVATVVLTAGNVTADVVAHAVRAIHADGDVALVEARVQGVEVTAGILDVGELLALPLVEIQPKDGRFFDYEEKYSAGGAREVCPAENVDAAQVRAVQAAARAFFEASGCAGYGRVDFIVPKAGPPVFLELNTLPGMTPRSLFPQAALAAGYPFEEMCAAIADAAWRERGRANSTAKNACK